jgi:glycosyltransferase involved in cell wall biosynthesis
MDSYSKDLRVVIVRNDTNKGVAFSLNLGIKVAKDLPRVQYIARMDSDDLCFKDRLLQ